jgi:hypothetical protein
LKESCKSDGETGHDCYENHDQLRHYCS